MHVHVHVHVDDCMCFQMCQSRNREAGRNPGTQTTGRGCYIKVRMWMHARTHGVYRIRMYARSCTHECLYCNLPKLVAPDNSQSDGSNSNSDTASSSPTTSQSAPDTISKGITQIHG